MQAQLPGKPPAGTAVTLLGAGVGIFKNYIARVAIPSRPVMKSNVERPVPSQTTIFAVPSRREITCLPSRPVAKYCTYRPLP